MVLHPTCVLLLTALVVALTSGVRRRILLLAGVTWTLWQVLSLTPAAHWTFAVPPYTLTLLQVDALSYVFALIFSLITCIGVLYALHVTHGGEHAAALVYAGAAIGVVLAGDWITFFLCWELMAMASLCLIWYGGTPRAYAAGMRYLLVHIGGGSLLLCGILLYMTQGGSLTLQPLTTAPHVSATAFWLILAGVAINAAIPPLHAWLTDAYPEAAVTGSVFLSAFTTKAAVYVLIRLFPGAETLVWVGTIMTLYGVVFAILEHDVRRLLSYHIVSQVGYMVTAVGLGTALALNGAAAHAFCHILYKALLFMGMGAVIQATGTGTLHHLGGLGRSMPVVCGLYMVAAFSIAGMPLFNGFISKSMIIAAAAEEHRPWPELLLTLAGVGTFLSVGLKLPFFTFLGQAHTLPTRPIPWNMLGAMSLAAAMCVWLGVQPEWLYRRLPLPATYQPYTVDHVLSSLQLLLGTALGFWWCLTLFGHTPTITLDSDWLYRRPLVAASQALIAIAQRFGAMLEARSATCFRTVFPSVQHLYHMLRLLAGPLRHRHRTHTVASLPYDGPRCRLPIGVTVLWIMIFFLLAVLYMLGWQRLATAFPPQHSKHAPTRPSAAVVDSSPHVPGNGSASLSAGRITPSSMV